MVTIVKKYVRLEAVLLSLLSTFAILCKFECVVGAKDGALLNGMYKLYSAFTINNLSDIFAFVFLYLTIHHILENYGKFDCISFVCAFVLSVLYVISMSYKKYYNMDFLLTDKFQLLLSLMCIAGYTVLIYFLLRIVEIVLDKKSQDNVVLIGYNSDSKRHIWGLSFSIILICWLPWIIFNYPGTTEPDSEFQLMQYFGATAFTSHHPPLNTYLRGWLIDLGEMIYDVNLGVFFYVILQTILGSAIFALCVERLSEFGIKQKYCFIATLFFVLPIWGAASQGCGKDFLFSESIVLFSICVVDIVRKKKCTWKNVIYISIVGILASLLRKNGIYSVAPTIIVIALWLRKADRKRMYIAVVVTFLVYGGIVKILYPSLGIKDGSISEALSMPFAQTANYVISYGDDVTDYEKEVISSVISYESLLDYSPINTDSIKATYKGDNSKLPEYFKVWFQMFFKHPDSYFGAFTNKAACYIAPIISYQPAPYTDKIEDFYGQIGVTHPFGNKYIDFFLELVYINLELPLLDLTCSPGAYTWVVIICIMLLVRGKIYKGIILFIPSIMNVLVCIASPTWGSRYAMPVMLSLPLMLGWTWYMLKGNNELRT